MMPGGLPLRGIGGLPEAISARGAMPCGEERAVAGDRRIAGGNLRKGGYAVRRGESRCGG